MCPSGAGRDRRAATKSWNFPFELGCFVPGVVVTRLLAHLYLSPRSFNLPILWGDSWKIVLAFASTLVLVFSEHRHPCESALPRRTFATKFCERNEVLRTTEDASWSIQRATVERCELTYKCTANVETCLFTKHGLRTSRC